ncbi:MAG: hypothetical protein ACOH5I_07215 [Oligoflexus sp.]
MNRPITFASAGVIGSSVSGVLIVPAIADEVGQLSVLQRTVDCF